jgi:hypothetical protein
VFAEPAIHYLSCPFSCVVRGITVVLCEMVALVYGRAAVPPPGQCLSSQASMPAAIAQMGLATPSYHGGQSRRLAVLLLAPSRCELTAGRPSRLYTVISVWLITWYKLV